MWTKPVKEGDIVELTIESTGAKGDGVAKVENFVVIVPGAKEGDTVKVRITRVLRKMAFADLLSDDEAQEGSHEETSSQEMPEQDSHEEMPEQDSNEESTEEAREEMPAEEAQEEA